MPRANKTQKYDYLLRYVKEAAEARLPLIAMCERTVLAYKQCPLHNTYKENAQRYVQNIGNGDPERINIVQNDSYPRQSTGSIQSLSIYQWHFSQN